MLEYLQNKIRSGNTIHVFTFHILIGGDAESLSRCSRARFPTPAVTNDLQNIRNQKPHKVSRETIYTVIYVMPCDELHTEVIG